jgi:hypothetical protein
MKGMMMKAVWSGRASDEGQCGRIEWFAIRREVWPWQESGPG